MPSSVRASSATSSSASGMGEAAARVAGALDLPGGVGQLGDRPHRPLGGRQAGEQREHGAAEHAEQQEELHPGERVVDVGERPGVEQRDLAGRAAPPMLAHLDPVARSW